LFLAGYIDSDGVMKPKHVCYGGLGFVSYAWVFFSLADSVQSTELGYFSVHTT